ncbi:MAG: caspase family protein [Bacteroidetes bacterium]|nr:caspase family protein [Bacteroidota bacterium]
MKKVVFVVISFFILQFAGATTIYEIKYKFDSSNVEYTAFLVRYENGTGFMRVRYKNNLQKTKVVSMVFDEINGTDNGKKTLRFEGKDPKFILGDDGDSYAPDYIWFMQNPGEVNYAPWGVTSPQADGRTLQGIIISVTLLNTNDITRTYANLFFGTGETFYVNLFNSPTTNNTAQNSSTLKLYVIANTLDEDIGSTCQKDVARVKHKFNDIASFLGMKMEYTEITGTSFNKNIIVNTLNNLDSKSDDIIVVCYSGHGFRYSNDRDHPYPQFDLTTSSTQIITENTMNAADVYTLLNKQSAHLKLLFTDCCNSEIRQSRPFGHSNPFTAKSRVQWNKTNCEQLFINTNGTIIASAASAGEVAFCNSDIGGYFLYNLVESLDKALDVFSSNPSWQNIIDETRKRVLSMTSNSNCNYQVCTESTVYWLGIK